jgi:excisionase family DNA binding protein
MYLCLLWNIYNCIGHCVACIIPFMSIEMATSGDEWLTVQEAAKLTGYHAEYLRILIRTGKITARKFGPVWAISKPVLLTYLRIAEKSKDRRHGPK